MEILAELTEKGLGISDEQYSGQGFRVRKAARAVIVDGDKTAILSVEKHQFFKIPGGGIEEGEDVKEALVREAVEEAGCEIEIGEPLGIIIEYRKQQQLVQLSYCYLATVSKHLESTAFTDKEADDGFALRWVTLAEAKKLFAKADTKDYSGKFMNARDNIFFEKGLSILS